MDLTEYMQFVASKEVFHNIVMADAFKGWGAPQEVMRPDGVMVPAAVLGTADQARYWVPTDYGYIEVDRAGATVYRDWLGNALGANAKIAADPYAADKVDWTPPFEAMGVDLAQIIGSGWWQGACIDFSGAGA